MPAISGKLDPIDAVEAALQALNQRTEEEIEEAVARILAKSRLARPLPPGKTLEDVVVGQWPGDETDEEIEDALKELS